MNLLDDSLNGWDRNRSLPVTVLGLSAKTMRLAMAFAKIPHTTIGRAKDGTSSWPGLSLSRSMPIASEDGASSHACNC